MDYKRNIRLYLIKGLFPNIKYNQQYILTYSKLHEHSKHYDTNYRLYLLEGKLTSYERKYDLIGMLACYDLINKVKKDEI